MAPGTRFPVMSALLGLTLLGASPSFPPASECLEVRLGDWRPAPPASADSLALALPTRIRLTDEPEPRAPDTLPGWSVPRRIATAPGALDSVHEERSWQEGPDGRLLLRFATRGSGVLLRADSASAERAEASSWWDLPLPTHRTEARLERVACDAPLAEADRFRWDFPTQVPTLEDPGLELGAPLPAVPEDPLTGAGFLAGAEGVQLEMGEGGRLRRVVAFFPDESVPRARLLERLEESWGSPDVMYGTTYRWLGRSLRYTMFAPTPGGWTVEMEVRAARIPPVADLSSFDPAHVGR